MLANYIITDSSLLSIRIQGMMWIAFKLTFGLHVWRPKRQVVPQKLHDQRWIPITLLAQRVQLSDRVVEGALCQLTGAVGWVEDLVVEDREVECKSESNRVSWSKIGQGHITGCLVGHQTALGNWFALIASCKLGQISVIIALPVWSEDNSAYLQNRRPCNDKGRTSSTAYSSLHFNKQIL